MDYVNLGDTGLKVSRICLGCLTYGDPNWQSWILGEDDSRTLIKQALELGINFFDTADFYSIGVSEHVVGRALADFTRRDEVVIATKVYNPMADDPNRRGLGRKHIMHAIDDSLTRLGTDYVDLYQIHRWDYETPIEETMAALHDVVKAGKARYLGASSMWARQFQRAQFAAERAGWTRFVAMQNLYNLLYREEEREMLPLCAETGVGVIPWSPLARGYLAGARKPAAEGWGETARAQGDAIAHEMMGSEEDFTMIARVEAVAEARGVKPAQVALAWLYSKPVVTAPIIGASKPGHLEDAAGAVGLELTAEEIATLEELYRPRPVVRHR